jgi:hypothetical protein
MSERRKISIETDFYVAHRLFAFPQDRLASSLKGMRSLLTSPMKPQLEDLFSRCHAEDQEDQEHD